MKKIIPFIIAVFLFSCTYDKPGTVDITPNYGYPDSISKILVTKCAVEGCHNTASRSSCAGLDFSTWDMMFEGGRNGTSVIPYSVDYSFALYTVNTDSLRGPVLLPTMPYLQPNLSNDEYQTLVHWIANGAPDKNGFVKFSDDVDRKKIYICMQGCDKVAVVDEKSKIIMRYISVGNDPTMIEAPHQVRVSPDNNYWYAVFYAGNVLQKFRTSDDSLISTLALDVISHNWNTLIFTPDGHKGFVNALDGTTAVVDLDNMTLETRLSSYSTPHGGFVTPDGRFLYLTCQNGNFVYKIDLNSAPFYDQDTLIGLIPGQQVSVSSQAQPHEMMLSPDGSKYFVSCQGTAEVRVFKTSNDSLLAVIPVGTKPQEFAVSTTHPYIFVTCTENQMSPSQKGSVYVINYNTNTLVGSPIYSGYQPHGLAVDDDANFVYVANLNYDPNGPAPHHVTACGGRNGYLTIIDMNTLQLYNKSFSDGYVFQYKTELLSFPYFVSYKK